MALAVFVTAGLLAPASSAVGAPTTCSIQNAKKQLTGEFTYSLSSAGDRDWAVLQLVGAMPVHYECPGDTDGCFNKDADAKEAVDMVGLLDTTTLVRSVTIINAPATSTMIHYKLSNCR